MRPLLPVTTALVAALLLPASPAHAAGEACQQRPATLVGSPGQLTLSGTEGDDVIVTAGSTLVRALGGNDLVCVTGPGAHGVSVDAGAGDDVVDASAATGRVNARLGAGSDRYTGSPADDSVYGGSTDDRGSADAEQDVILTGTGSDVVGSGTPGSGVPNSDVVVLGGGGGHLGGQVSWFGPMGPGARLDGGAPGNTLVTDLGADPRADVVVDAASATLRRDGATVLSWTSFDSFHLTAVAAPAAFSFTGSQRDERLILRIPGAASGTHRIDLGGGDDRLWMGDDAVGGRGSSYAGGAGADHAVLWADGRLALDLASGRLETVRQGRTVRGTVAGFETHLVGAKRLVLRGTKKADELRFWGCTATVRGRGGRDDIALSNGDDDFEVPACKSPSIRLHGDGGDDRIRGTLGDDLLVGGRGRDTISGNGGRDRCSGERLTSCEVRVRG